LVSNEPQSEALRESVIVQSTEEVPRSASHYPHPSPADIWRSGQRVRITWPAVAISSATASRGKFAERKHEELAAENDALRKKLKSALAREEALHAMLRDFNVNK
jgi:hypothetical protein